MNHFTTHKSFILVPLQVYDEEFKKINFFLQILDKSGIDECRESGYLIQNLIKIIKLFKPSGLYNMTMRVKLYGPFLYKKKGRTQHLTSVSSFTQQCFR